MPAKPPNDTPNDTPNSNRRAPGAPKRSPTEKTTTEERAEMLWMVGPDGTQGYFVSTREASRRLGMLTPRVVQNACAAYTRRIAAERAAQREGTGPAPDYTAHRRELVCQAMPQGQRTWYWVREDGLSGLQYISPAMHHKPGVQGRVAGVSQKTWRGQPVKGTYRISPTAPTTPRTRGPSRRSTSDASDASDDDKA